MYHTCPIPWMGSGLLGMYFSITKCQPSRSMRHRDLRHRRLHAMFFFTREPVVVSIFPATSKKRPENHRNLGDNS